MSDDVRQRVLFLHERGVPVADIVDDVGYSRAAVYALVKSVAQDFALTGEDDYDAPHYTPQGRRLMAYERYWIHEIRHFAQYGYTVTRLAEQMGISARALSHLVSEMRMNGVLRDPRTPRPAWEPRPVALPELEEDDYTGEERWD